MRYDVIVTDDLGEINLGVVGNTGGQIHYATFKKQEQNRSCKIVYAIDRVGSLSWLAIKVISLISCGAQTRITPDEEKNLPDDLLEELAFLVNVHKTKGVFWNSLFAIDAFVEEDYPEQFLSYKVIEGMGDIPRVTFHDKIGEFFYLDVDGVSYRSVKSRDISEMIAQRHRLGVNIPIESPVCSASPGWILIRDSALKYSTAKFIDA